MKIKLQIQIIDFFLVYISALIATLSLLNQVRKVDNKK